jgi:hypothetical protein
MIYKRKRVQNVVEKIVKCDRCMRRIPEAETTQRKFAKRSLKLFEQNRECDLCISCYWSLQEWFESEDSCQEKERANK